MSIFLLCPFHNAVQMDILHVLIHSEKVKEMLYGMVAPTDLSCLTKLHPLCLFPVCVASTRQLDSFTVLTENRELVTGYTDTVDCYNKCFVFCISLTYLICKRLITDQNTLKRGIIIYSCTSLT